MYQKHAHCPWNYSKQPRCRSASNLLLRSTFYELKLLFNTVEMRNWLAFMRSEQVERQLTMTQLKSMNEIVSHTKSNWITVSKGIEQTKYSKLFLVMVVMFRFISKSFQKILRFFLIKPISSQMLKNTMNFDDSRLRLQTVHGIYRLKWCFKSLETKIASKSTSAVENWSKDKKSLFLSKRNSLRTKHKTSVHLRCHKSKQISINHVQHHIWSCFRFIRPLCLCAHNRNAVGLEKFRLLQLIMVSCSFRNASRFRPTWTYFSHPIEITRLWETFKHSQSSTMSCDFLHAITWNTIFNMCCVERLNVT